MRCVFAFDLNEGQSDSKCFFVRYAEMYYGYIDDVILQKKIQAIHIWVHDEYSYKLQC